MTAKKKAASISTEDLTKKALQRLVDALISPCESQSRIDAVEEALAYAGLALGKEIRHERVIDMMEVLAAQILINNLSKSDAVAQSIRLASNDASIITTSSPVLARHINDLIAHHTREPPKAFNNN